MLRRLAGHTAAYGLSSVVARFINYLLTPYLTRVLTKEVYGNVTDFYSLIPFIVIVLTMGMETGYFRFAAKAADGNERQKVFSTTWGATLLASGMFLLLALLFFRPLATAMRYGDHPSYVLLIAGIIVADIAAIIPFNRLRFECRPGRFAAIKVVNVLVNVAACLFFYSVLPRISGGMWFSSDFGAGYVLVANLIASAVTLLILYPDYRGMRPRIDKVLFRTIFVYSLPLLISGIAGTANEFIDRQFIKFLLPRGIADGQLGIYGATTKVAVIIVLFTQMYRMAAEPFFLSEFKKDDFRRANAEAMKYFIVVSVGIYLLMTLFLPEFSLIVGADFRQGMSIIPMVLLANILAGVWLNLSFWYKQTHQTKYAMWITGSGLVFTLGLNIALIPALGYEGAAITRLCSEAVMVAASYFLCMRHYPIPFDLRRIGLYVLAGVGLYRASRLWMDGNVLLRYGLNVVSLALFVALVVKKEEIDLVRLARSVMGKR